MSHTEASLVAWYRIGLASIWSRVRCCVAPRGLYPWARYLAQLASLHPGANEYLATELGRVNLQYTGVVSRENTLYSQQLAPQKPGISTGPMGPLGL